MLLPRIEGIQSRQRLSYVHGLALLMLSILRLLQVNGVRYRHPPAQRCHLSSLGGAQLIQWYTHLGTPHILIHRMLSHDSLPLLLLLL